MQIDFTSLAPLEAYRWLASTVTPRPIAWVSTRAADGQANLAPFSFFQVISDEPPTLMVNIGLRDGQPKDSLRNLEANGELVINLVSAAQAAAMNATAEALPYGISEFERCGIASEPSSRIGAPRVKGAVVAFECRVAQLLPYPPQAPNCHLVFAEVLLAHLDDRVLDARGRVDPAALDLVGRLGGQDYCYTRERFQMARP